MYFASVTNTISRLIRVSSLRRFEHELRHSHSGPLHHDNLLRRKSPSESHDAENARNPPRLFVASVRISIPELRREYAFAAVGVEPASVPKNGCSLAFRE